VTFMAYGSLPCLLNNVREGSLQLVRMYAYLLCSIATGLTGGAGQGLEG
jgi:hypothetical protein